MSKIKVAGYVKLAKLWERSRELLTGKALNFPNLFEDFSNYEASGSPTENQEVQSLHSGAGEGSIIE